MAGSISPEVFYVAIFVLAVFIGYFVVWSVTPALHTPLMSVANAISGIIIVGSLIAVNVHADVAESPAHLFTARVLGVVSLALATINCIGGFWITQRMLGMYKKRKDR